MITTMGTVTEVLLEEGKLLCALAPFFVHLRTRVVSSPFLPTLPSKLPSSTSPSSSAAASIPQCPSNLSSSSCSPTSSTNSLIEKILSSTPLLESFGNSATLRNSNSSRFGKYITLNFGRKGVIGGQVETFLLEKVRVTSQGKGERGFHIFYQLAEGFVKGKGVGKLREILPKYHTPSHHGDDFACSLSYAFGGGVTEIRGMDDFSCYNELVTSMKSLGWSDGRIGEVFDVVAGVLIMGQVKFEEVEIGGELKCKIGDSSASVVSDVCSLWGVSESFLTSALTRKVMVTRGETMWINLTVQQGMDGRDSLARNVYGGLFDWVVNQVNDSIRGWKGEGRDGGSSGSR